MSAKCLRFIKILLGLTGFYAQITFASPFGMNDVSMLLPLPLPAQVNEMLSPRDEGGDGPLIPDLVYAKLGTLYNNADAENVYREQLRVIGIRLDPCFQEGANPTPCRRQIRLIWQPVVVGTSGVTTEDAALHTFYDFTPTEWANILSAFRPLASGDLAAPLQIHPKLLQEGYSGETWSNLKKIILTFCGTKHLSRATATRLKQNRMWTFLGFNQNGSDWVPMRIPNIASALVTVVLNPENLNQLNEFSGMIAPAVQGDSLLSSFVQSSVQFKDQRPESDTQTLMREVIQFENPKLNNSGTIDCASCHLSQTVKLWGVRNFPNWNWQTLFQNALFSSSRNLENTSVNRGGLANQFRAFGYDGINPILSDRVINETAKVSERLSKQR